MKQADILIVNGRVLTLDGKGSRAEAVAIAGNEIIFAGDGESARALRHKGTRMIDAQGATVLPGFIESHMHVFSGAAELDQSLLETLAGYTADGAWTEFMEDRKGRIAHGMLADIVVLSDDIEAVDRQAIDKLKPIVTICDGRVTYEA